jgi:spermidine/putrescine transport system substrate-binding protein
MRLESRRSRTRRAVLAGATSLVLLAGIAGCADGRTAETGGDASAEAGTIPLEADGDITWYTWEGFVDPAVVDAFEAEYDVTVTEEYFDSDETMLQKLATGLPYDVVTSNSAYMERALAADLLQPINWDALDKSDLLPYFEAPWYDDDEARYSAPYGYGPTGFLYKKDVVTETDSWDAFWNSPEAAGRITVLTQAEETIGMALLSLGYDLNSDDPDEIAEAVDKLLELKPDLAAISSSTSEDALQDRADLMQTWSGSAYYTLTQLENPEEWAFSLPENQSPLGVDLLTVGANAESPGTAMLFLDWMLQPENSAANATYTGYYFGTQASSDAVDVLTEDYPFLRLEDDFYDDAQWKESATGERLQILTEQWNRFKA